jgi:hypothetical protein
VLSSLMTFHPVLKASRNETGKVEIGLSALTESSKNVPRSSSAARQDVQVRRTRKAGETKPALCVSDLLDDERDGT